MLSASLLLLSCKHTVDFSKCYMIHKLQKQLGEPSCLLQKQTLRSVAEVCHNASILSKIVL